MELINYISHFGIGHEAWNFNKNELIDGKVYGYLKADVSSLFSEKHNIFFFSRDSNGDLFFVGYYKDCKYLTEEERIKLKEKMVESGLLDKRINQVYRILKNEDDFSEWSWDDVESEFGFEVSSFKLICPHCQTQDNHYFIRGRRQWRCKCCNHTFSVTSGTIDRSLPEFT